MREVVVVRVDCCGVAVRRDRGWCAGSMACIALSGVDEAFAVALVAILPRLRHQISRMLLETLWENPAVLAVLLVTNGDFPNNKDYPVLVYKVWRPCESC